MWAADKQVGPNHMGSNSILHQSQVHTVLRQPSLVTAARADKFGLSFWGPEIPACLHTTACRGEEGERESTKQRRRRTRESSLGGCRQGGAYTERWSKRRKRKERRKKKAWEILFEITLFHAMRGTLRGTGRGTSRAEQLLSTFISHEATKQQLVEVKVHTISMTASENATLFYSHHLHCPYCLYIFFKTSQSFCCELSWYFLTY